MKHFRRERSCILASVGEKDKSKSLKEQRPESSKIGHTRVQKASTSGDLSIVTIHREIHSKFGQFKDKVVNHNQIHSTSSCKKCHVSG